MSSYVEANDQNSTDIFGLLKELENRAASHTTGSHSDWPAGVSMTELGYLDGVTSAVQNQLDGKMIGRSTNITVTVGSGGDYSTINAALAALSKYYPLYVSGGFTATINLLTGFVMNEQVIVRNGVDLGWITITGEDASTNVASALYTNSPISMGSNIPLFAALINSTLPVIDHSFVGTNATGSMGIYLNINSKGVLTSGNGFSNIKYGVFVDNNCIFYGQGCILSCTNVPINAREGSLIYIYDAILSTTSWTMIYSWGGTFYADGIVATNSGWSGLYLDGGTIFNGNGIDVSGASDRGIFSNNSWCNVPNIIATGCGTYGVQCIGGTMNIIEGNAQKGASPASTDIIVQNGGTISAASANGGTNITVNTITASGIIYR